MIKLVIFDLDGTLINTLEGIKYSGNLVGQTYGMKPLPGEFFRNAIGHGAKGLVEAMIKQHRADDALLEEMLKKFVDVYTKNWEEGIYPYDGMVDLVNTLNRHGIHVAINTNKPQAIAQKAAWHAFDKEIIKIIKGACDDYAKKPSPEGVNQILDAYDVLPSECIYIGDSIVDIETAKNAQIKSVGVLWGFGQKADVENADNVVSCAEEINALILG